MVETTRLQIIPLTYEQLEDYLLNNRLFLKKSALAGTGRTVADDVRKRIQLSVIPAMKQLKGSDYLYITFWIVVDKSIKSIVAELGFKGVPNERGEIEIGYGTMPEMRGKGYMTEAVGAMVGWARGRDGVTAILAETDQSNHASIKVVTRNNFVQFDKRGKMLWWKYIISNDQGAASVTGTILKDSRI